ncbi:MAG: transpeptidase family protein [Acidobacteriia bacterium]|nr:transpeptidase family protein [Terriglobia bacterium]
MPPRQTQARPAISLGSMTLSRGLLLGGLLALWMLALVGRLYYLQIIQYVDLLARAERQQQRTIEIAPKRGTIYDRQMQPLAMSVATDSVFAVPSEIPNPEMVADLLAPVLGLGKGDLLGRFKTFKSFCWVKRKVSGEEASRLRDLNLRGIYFQKEMKRFYPKGELAAQVLGYVGLDDHGLGGLEYRMEDTIQGTPGRVLIAADARRQSFHSTERTGQPGKNVVLTLDENIQYIAEKALADAAAKWRMASGTVVVQSPQTGEILAMASYPTFDPNEFGRSAPESRINRAISWVFEPGSTFKLVAVSAALEEHLTTPQEVINCQNGSIMLSGHVIHDDHAYGDLTVSQVVARSSDVGAIKLGLRLGEDRFYRYIRAFGFGSPTGLDLPGAERGLLQPPSRWSGISIGELSIGQEVGVTALQLISAYSAIANDGVLFQPRVVRDVFLGGLHDSVDPASGRRIVSQETAERMKEILSGVIESGTGTTAQLAGYSAGGKTGTAQKIDSSGTYSRTHHVASFVGFSPVRNPAVAILVVIDSPVGAYYGREVAAPVFRSVAEQTLGYLNVPQDNPSSWPQVASSAPAGSPRQKRGGRAGFPPLGSEPPGVAPSLPVRTVSFTNPPLPEAGGTLILDDGPMVPVPDFAGMALRQVAEACQKLGLDLNMRGSGVAVEQMPPARALVPSGSRILVRFAR